MAADVGTMNITDRCIYRFLKTVNDAADAVVPRIKMTPGERMTRSGHLFEQAPLLVQYTAGVLRNHPGLFDDLPLQPGPLLFQQQRAFAWKKLYFFFSRLAQRAYDCYLFDQSEPVIASMSLVKQVRQEQDCPYPHPRQKERREALCVVERVLADRHQRKLDTARRKRNARTPAPSSNASAAPIAGQPPPGAIAGPSTRQGRGNRDNRDKVMRDYLSLKNRQYLIQIEDQLFASPPRNTQTPPSPTTAPVARTAPVNHCTLGAGALAPPQNNAHEIPDLGPRSGPVATAKSTSRSPDRGGQPATGDPEYGDSIASIGATQDRAPEGRDRPVPGRKKE